MMRHRGWDEQCFNPIRWHLWQSSTATRRQHPAMRACVDGVNHSTCPMKCCKCLPQAPTRFQFLPPAKTVQFHVPSSCPVGRSPLVQISTAATTRNWSKNVVKLAQLKFCAFVPHLQDDLPWRGPVQLTGARRKQLFLRSDILSLAKRNDLLPASQRATRGTRTWQIENSARVETFWSRSTFLFARNPCVV